MQGYEMIRNEGYRMGLNLGKNEMIEDPEITTKIYTWWERWIEWKYQLLFDFFSCCLYLD